MPLSTIFVIPFYQCQIDVFFNKRARLKKIRSIKVRAALFFMHGTIYAFWFLFFSQKIPKFRHQPNVRRHKKGLRHELDIRNSKLDQLVAKYCAAYKIYNLWSVIAMWAVAIFILQKTAIWLNHSTRRQFYCVRCTAWPLGCQVRSSRLTKCAADTV